MSRWKSLLETPAIRSFFRRGPHEILSSVRRILHGGFHKLTRSVLERDENLGDERFTLHGFLYTSENDISTRRHFADDIGWLHASFCVFSLYVTDDRCRNILNSFARSHETVALGLTFAQVRFHLPNCSSLHFGFPLIVEIPSNSEDTTQAIVLFQYYEWLPDAISFMSNCCSKFRYFCNIWLIY